MAFRVVTDEQIQEIILNHDTSYTDKDGNPCNIRAVGTRRIGVVVRLGSDPPHVTTVIVLGFGG